jgi:hypothetical protein
MFLVDLPDRYKQHSLLLVSLLVSQYLALVLLLINDMIV